jgi:hypothetical protein
MLNYNLKKIVILLITILPFVGFSQIGPAAPGNGAYVIIDTSYFVGSSIEGETKARITLQNTTPTLITGVQFRLFYDSVAFSSASVALVDTTLPNLYLQSLVNQNEGHITITLVYTGSSTSYSIPNGELFEITFTHITNSDFQALSSIDNLSLTGTQTFTELASTQDGLDTILTLHNYGGEFIRPSMQFELAFTNISGSPSKDLFVSLERKTKLGTTWAQFETYQTDLNGLISIDEIIDTTSWDVRIVVQGDTMGVGNAISVADAHKINQWVTTEDIPYGFDYYLGDVNGDDEITISDAYGVFARIAGRFNQWSNNVADVKFFTESEYNTIINDSVTNYTSTISGATNFTYEILPNIDSATFYVLVPGDANNTGFNMARMTPIRITNPTNSPNYLIDVSVEYDVELPTIEINIPNLSVNEGNLISLPISLLSDMYSLSALQLGLVYDDELIEFKELNNSEKTMKWLTFVNSIDNTIIWGGYDPTNQNFLSNIDTAFTLNFVAKKPQDEWVSSPIHTTEKFVGDANSNDMNISPTNGIIEIKRISNNVISNINELIIYPNPTQNGIYINFNVTQSSNVDLTIRSIDGRIVSKIIDKQMPVGNYTYFADLNKLAGGVYYATIIADADFQIGKIVLIK